MSVKIRVEITDNNPGKKTSRSPMNLVLGDRWVFRIRPCRLNWIQRGSRSLIGRLTINEPEPGDVMITFLNLDQVGDKDNLQRMLLAEVRLNPKIIELTVGDENWLVDGDRIIIYGIEKIENLSNRENKKLDDQRIRRINHADNPPVIDNRALSEIAIEQLENLVPLEVKVDLGAHWQQFITNIQDRDVTQEGDNLNDEGVLRDYVNRVFSLAYIQGVLGEANRLSANNTEQEINAVLTKLNEFRQAQPHNVGAHNDSLFYIRHHNLGGFNAYQRAINEIEHLNRIVGFDAVPWINLNNHRGEIVQDHIDLALNHYNDYLPHTINGVANKGAVGGRVPVDLSIQKWLEFALGADDDEPKNLQWLANHINLISNENQRIIIEAGDVPLNITELIEGKLQEVAINLADLREHLVRLCRDEVLIRNARRNVFETINGVFNNPQERRILKRLINGPNEGEALEDYNLETFNENYAGAFNLVDLYFLDSLITDLLGDEPNIQNAFQQKLFQQIIPTINLASIEEGGDTYGRGNNYSQIRKWFAELIARNFRSIPPNEDRIVNSLLFLGRGDADNCPLRHHFNVAWEQMALMLSLIRERRELEISLARQGRVDRGDEAIDQLLNDFRALVIENENDFWEEFPISSLNDRNNLGRNKINLAKTWKVRKWLNVGGTGRNIEGDQAVLSNQLPEDTTPREWSAPLFAGNDRAIREVRRECYQEWQNVLTNRALRQDAKILYLSDLHKRIALRRIQMYLDNHEERGEVLSANLPIRTNNDFNTAGGNLGTIAFANNQSYRDYQDIINNALYDETKLNGFVVEVCGKIKQQRLSKKLSEFRFKGNLVDRNWNQGNNLETDSAAIDRYNGKGLSKLAAILLYNLGVDPDTINPNDHEDDGSRANNFNAEDNLAYNLTLEGNVNGGLKAFAQQRSTRINPLSNDGRGTWGATGDNAATLSLDEVVFIGAWVLNSGLTKHAAAVLLAHVCQVKGALGGGLTQQLDQDGHNWFNKTQEELDGIITNVAEEQHQALKEFAEAARIVADLNNPRRTELGIATKSLVWDQFNQVFTHDGNGLGEKVLQRAEELSNARARATGNRVDRNWTADDNISANPNFFDLYLEAKGIPNKKTAQLLYNVGLNAATLANVADGGVTNATTFRYRPVHANAVGTGEDIDYDLTNADRLMAYVAARSLDKDPLNGNGDQNWADDLAIHETEAALINNNALNTAETKHYAAVLLSHLKRIKLATGGVITSQLSQNVGGGGAEENTQNWLKPNTNIAAISAINNVTETQLKALEEFAAANAIDNATGKGLVWARMNELTDGVNGASDLVTKILARVRAVTFDVVAFRAQQLGDNSKTKIARNWDAAGLGDQINNDAAGDDAHGSRLIQQYAGKGLTGATAGLVYNLGIGHADINALGNPNAGEVDHRFAHDGTTAIGGGGAYWYDLKDRGVYNAGTNNLIAYVRSKLITYNPLTDNAWNDGVGVALHADEITLLQQGMNDVPEAKLAAAVLIAHLRLVKDATGATNLIAGNDWTAAGNQVHVDAAIVAANADLLALLEDFNGAGGGTAKRLAWDQINADWNQVAANVLAKLRTVGFSLNEFRDQLLHQHSGTKMARQWTNTTTDQIEENPGTPTTGTGLIQQYAGKGLTGATAGLVYNLGIGHADINALGNPNAGEVDHRFAHDGTTAIGGGGAYWYDLKDRGVYNAGTNNLIAYVRSKLITYNPLTDNAWNDGVGVALHADEITLLQQGMNDVPEAKLAAAVLIAHLRLVKDATGATNLIAGNDWTAAGNQVHVDAAIVAANADLLALLEDFNGAGGGTAKRLAWDQINADWNQVAANVLAKLRTVGFSLNEFRDQLLHQHSGTKMARQWTNTTTDQIEENPGTPTTGTGLIQQYAGKGLTGATAGLVYNLGIGHADINALGNPNAGEVDHRFAHDGTTAIGGGGAYWYDLKDRGVYNAGTNNLIAYVRSKLITYNPLTDNAWNDGVGVALHADEITLLQQGMNDVPEAKLAAAVLIAHLRLVKDATGATNLIAGNDWTAAGNQVHVDAAIVAANADLLALLEDFNGAGGGTAKRLAWDQINADWNQVAANVLAKLRTVGFSLNEFRDQLLHQHSGTKMARQWTNTTTDQIEENPGTPTTGTGLIQQYAGKGLTGATAGLVYNLGIGHADINALGNPNAGEVDHRFAHDGTTAIGGGGAYWYDLKDRGVYNAGTNNLIAYVRSKLITYNPLTDNAWNDGVGVALHADEITLLQQGMNDVPEAKLAAAVLIAHLRLVKDATGATNLIAGNDWTAAGNQVHVDAAIVAANADLLALLEDFNGAGGGTAKRLAWDQINADWNQVAANVLAKLRTVGFSLNEFRDQLLHQHSGTKMARQWTNTTTDQIEENPGTPTTGTGLIQQYAGKGLTGATAGLVYNLGIGHADINALGNPNAGEVDHRFAHDGTTAIGGGGAYWYDLKDRGVYNAGTNNLIAYVRSKLITYNPLTDNAWNDGVGVALHADEITLLQQGMNDVPEAKLAAAVLIAHLRLVKDATGATNLIAGNDWTAAGNQVHVDAAIVAANADLLALLEDFNGAGGGTAKRLAWDQINADWNQVAANVLAKLRTVGFSLNEFRDQLLHQHSGTKMARQWTNTTTDQIEENPGTPTTGTGLIQQYAGKGLTGATAGLVYNLGIGHADINALGNPNAGEVDHRFAHDGTTAIGGGGAYWYDLKDRGVYNAGTNNLIAYVRSKLITYNPLTDNAWNDGVGVALHADEITLLQQGMNDVPEAKLAAAVLIAHLRLVKDATGATNLIAGNDWTAAGNQVHVDAAIVAANADLLALLEDFNGAGGGTAKRLAWDQINADWNQVAANVLAKLRTVGFRADFLATAPGLNGGRLNASHPLAPSNENARNAEIEAWRKGHFTAVDARTAYENGWTMATTVDRNVNKFSSMYFPGNRLSRLAGIDNEATQWNGKDITNKTAALLYNVGINNGGVNPNTHANNGTQANSFDIGDGTRFDLTDEGPYHAGTNNLIAFVQTRSLNINPLSTDHNSAWNDVNSGTNPIALDAAESTELISHAELDTPEAKHAGAVLLAHLRLIKAKSNGARSQQLNADENWLTKTQAEISGYLINPVDVEHLLALQEYSLADIILKNNGETNSNLDTIAKAKAWRRANAAWATADGTGLAEKVFKAATNLVKYRFGVFPLNTDTFSSMYFPGNRLSRLAGIDNEATQWNGKDITNKTAALLYNVGINNGGVNPNTHANNGTQANSFDIGDGTRFDLTDEGPYHAGTNNLIAFVQTRSLNINPLSTDHNSAWNDVNSGTNPIALDAAESTELISHAELDTPEAKHAGAVLLAHLRLIKAKSNGARSQQLNADENWLTKTQAEISGYLINPVDVEHLLALQEYSLADIILKNNGETNSNLDTIAKAKAWRRANAAWATADGTGLAEKVFKAAMKLAKAGYISAQGVKPTNHANLTIAGKYAPAEVLSPNPNPNWGIIINPLAIGWSEAQTINNPTTPPKEFDAWIGNAADAENDLRTAAKKAKHLQVDDAGNPWSLNPTERNLIKSAANRPGVIAAINAIKANRTPGGPGTNQLDVEKQSAITRIRSEMSRAPSVNDSELNSELNQNNWEAYIRGASNSNEVNSREQQAKNAIIKIRQGKQPKDLNQLRQEAIDAVSNHWKNKADSSGKINDQSQSQVLTSSWQSEIRNKNDQSAINAEKNRLIALIDAEKNKEGSDDIPPYYPPSGGGGSSGTDGKIPPKDSKDKKDENKDKTSGGDQGDSTPGGKIVQELGLQKVTPQTVNSILDEISTTTTTTTTTKEEKEANLDRAKQILEKIEKALNKHKFDNEAEELFDKLKENQKEGLTLQSTTLGQQVSNAVKHLEGLKKNQKIQTQEPQSGSPSEEGWWARQSTGAKVAIVGGALATVALVAVVVVNQTKKNQSDSSVEEDEEE